MGLTYVFAGFLFFLNPIVSLVDVLPDFLGCILIYFGLNKLSAVTETFDDTKKYVKWLAYVSIARTIAMFLGGGFDEMSVLAVSAVLAIVEFVIFCLAFPSLYEGLSYLNTNYEGKASEMPEFKIIGIAFIGIRGFFSLVPLLGSLSVIDRNYEHGYEFYDVSPYARILLFANILFTLAAAALFLWALVRYLFPLIRDEVFWGKLRRVYEDKVRLEPHYFLLRKLVFAFVVLTYAGFFLIDFIGDGINVIPDLIFAGLALWVVYILYDRSETAKKSAVSGGIYAFFTAANYIYNTIFMRRRYNLSFSMILNNYAEEYAISVVLAIFDAASLIIFLYFFTKMLSSYALLHTAIIVSEEFTRTVENNRIAAANINKYIKIYFVAGIISAVSTVLFTATMHAMPIYWMPHLAINITFFILSNILCAKFLIRVKSRYQKPRDVEY